ncbi:MAG: Hsp33 family molecular chaperone HslO [Clostridia bacterium]|nr:Hsp33 family molecular chaperone HslO [Clostridia bacterium]
MREMIDEDGEAELCCHFCNKKYHFDKEELEAIYNEGGSNDDN